MKGKHRARPKGCIDEEEDLGEGGRMGPRDLKQEGTKSESSWMGEKEAPRTQGQACCLSPRTEVEEQLGQYEYGGAGKLSLTSAIHPLPPRPWWEINIVLLISDTRFCVSRDQLLSAWGEFLLQILQVVYFSFCSSWLYWKPLLLVSGSQVLIFS